MKECITHHMCDCAQDHMLNLSFENERLRSYLQGIADIEYRNGERSPESQLAAEALKKVKLVDQVTNQT